MHKEDMAQGKRLLTLTLLAKEYGLKVQVMKNKMVAAGIINPETHLPFQAVVDEGNAVVLHTETPAYGVKPVQYAKYLLSYVEGMVAGPTPEERAARHKDAYDLEGKLLCQVANLAKPLGLHRYVSQGIENANLDKRLAELGLGKAEYALMRRCHLQEPIAFGGWSWIANADTHAAKEEAATRFMSQTEAIRAAAQGLAEAEFIVRVIELLVQAITAEHAA